MSPVHHWPMKAYSEDLRKKILEAVDKGMPKSEVAKTFGRTREAFVGATGHALGSITREDIRGFYADCGYRLSLQLL